MKKLFLFTITISLAACYSQSVPSKIKNEKTEHTRTQADKILADAIQAHGGSKYDKAQYQFVFRKKNYSFMNNGDQYKYEVRSMKGDTSIHDVLENGSFTRTKNGIAQNLSARKISGYSNSLNSVIYFATLPHKLNDPAVNKEYKGTTTIKGKAYDILQITFEKVGGGVDHDDTYYYWIGSEDHQIDFLAYSFHVNNGGVRFRSAQNKRNVNGIIFQDYINYKAEVGMPLADLPRLWEEGKLKKLSEILTEDVQAL